MAKPDTQNPLESIEEWEDDVLRRYPDTDYDPNGKEKGAFRNYDEPARDSVRAFYRLNHHNQTYDFAKSKQAAFKPGNREAMGIWEAMEYLNTLVDDSDPDTDLTQIEHLLQTSEAIRSEG